MNDSELNRILKEAKVPERPPEVRAQFPRRVIARLHWQPATKSAAAVPWFPRLAWAAGLAACVLVGFFIGHWRGQTDALAKTSFLQNGKVIREMLATFPNRVRGVVQDEHGLNVVLSEKDDVPVSAPLWVQICDGKNCATMVTFSGQQIRIGQRDVTVLSDANGKIILAGDNFLWSNGESLLADGNLKIEAKTLATVVL